MVASHTSTACVVAVPVVMAAVVLLPVALVRLSRELAVRKPVYGMTTAPDTTAVDSVIVVLQLVTAAALNLYQISVVTPPELARVSGITVQVPVPQFVALTDETDAVPRVLTNMTSVLLAAAAMPVTEKVLVGLLDEGFIAVLTVPRWIGVVGVHAVVGLVLHTHPAHGAPLPQAAPVTEQLPHPSLLEHAMGAWPHALMVLLRVLS